MRRRIWWRDALPSPLSSPRRRGPMLPVGVIGPRLRGDDSHENRDEIENDMNELIPTGILRAGVAFAPAPSPLFVTKDAGGTASGVTIDLAKALATKLGVAMDFLVAPNTGQLTD